MAWRSQVLCCAARCIHPTILAPEPPPLAPNGHGRRRQSAHSPQPWPLNPGLPQTLKPLDPPSRPWFQITVDGDTSTNDCVIGLASGVAGNATITDAASPEGKALEAAVTALMQASGARPPPPGGRSGGAGGGVKTPALLLVEWVTGWLHQLTCKARPGGGRRRRRSRPSGRPARGARGWWWWWWRQQVVCMALSSLWCNRQGCLDQGACPAPADGPLPSRGGGDQPFYPAASRVIKRPLPLHAIRCKGTAG